MAVRPAPVLQGPPPSASYNAQPVGLSWASNEALIARTILISGISAKASESSLRMLFGSMGRIESLLYSPPSDANSAAGGAASIVYATPEEAAAALRFNGCIGWSSLMDVRLAASTIGSNGSFARPSAEVPRPLTAPMDMGGSVRPAPRARPGSGHGSSSDVSPTHKNLYVLNLPLDATTDQLAALFAGYGSVVHCVILAMLDAQARRRGFIDMSAPEEAKSAIESLNGFVWKGYPIEVSYAIVQRSGGPFDNPNNRNAIKRNVPRNRFNTGPRRIPNEPFGVAAGYTAMGYDPSAMYAPLPGLPHASGHSPLSQAARSIGDGEVASLASDPRTILISGLDPVAVLNDEDLRRALQPYGHITAVSLSKDDAGVSRGFGIVTFSQSSEAHRAREILDGKVINGRKIMVKGLDASGAVAAAAAVSPNPSHRGIVPVGFPATSHTNNLPPHRHAIAPASFSYDERLHGHHQSISPALPLPLGYNSLSPSLPNTAHGTSLQDQQLNHPTHLQIAGLRPEVARTHSSPYSAGGPYSHHLAEPFEPKAISPVSAPAMSTTTEVPRVGSRSVSGEHRSTPSAGSGSYFPASVSGSSISGSVAWKSRSTSESLSSNEHSIAHSASASGGSHTTHSNSPGSTMSGSSASSLASELQTPGSFAHAHHHGHVTAHAADPQLMIKNTDPIWSLSSHGAATPSAWPKLAGSLANGASAVGSKVAQHAQGSTLSSLRRDSPPLQLDDLDPTRRANLAPVGHEKVGSPSRPVSRNTKSDASEQVLSTLNSLNLGD